MVGVLGVCVWQKCANGRIGWKPNQIHSFNYVFFAFVLRLQVQNILEMWTERWWIRCNNNKWPTYLWLRNFSLSKFILIIFWRNILVNNHLLAYIAALHAESLESLESNGYPGEFCIRIYESIAIYSHRSYTDIDTAFVYVFFFFAYSCCWCVLPNYCRSVVLHILFEYRFSTHITFTRGWR